MDNWKKFNDTNENSWENISKHIYILQEIESGKFISEFRVGYSEGKTRSVMTNDIRKAKSFMSEKDEKISYLLITGKEKKDKWNILKIYLSVVDKHILNFEK